MVCTARSGSSEWAVGAPNTTIATLPLSPPETSTSSPPRSSTSESTDLDRGDEPVQAGCVDGVEGVELDEPDRGRGGGSPATTVPTAADRSSLQAPTSTTSTASPRRPHPSRRTISGPAGRRPQLKTTPRGAPPPAPPAPRSRQRQPGRDLDPRGRRRGVEGTGDRHPPIPGDPRHQFSRPSGPAAASRLRSSIEMPDLAGSLGGCVERRSRRGRRR